MKHVVAIAILLLFAASHAMGSHLTTKIVERDLSQKGAPFTIKRYFDCSNGPGYLLVKSGDPAAVKLGVEMLKFSDACVTESLRSALGVAMALSPENVLPYVDTAAYLKAKDICLPFISDDEPRSRVRAIVARTKLALLRVQTRRLEKQKAACLIELADR